MDLSASDCGLKNFYQDSIDPIKQWISFFRKKRMACAQYATHFDKHVKRIANSMYRLMEILWGALFSPSLIYFGLALVGCIGLIVFCTWAFTPLCMLSGVVALCRVVLEVGQAICYGAIFILSIYAQFFPASPLLLSTQWTDDRKKIVILAQKLKSPIADPDLRPELPISSLDREALLLEVKCYSPREETQQSESLEQEVKLLFPSYSSEYHKALSDSLIPSMRTRNTALYTEMYSQVQQIYKDTTMPIVTSWAHFFQIYSTWDFFQEQWKMNTLAAKICEKTPMLNFRDFFTANLKTLSQADFLNQKPVVFEQCTVRANIEFVEKCKAYLSAESQFLYPLNTTEHSRWLDYIVGEYLYYRKPTVSITCDHYWTPEFLDCLQSVQERGQPSSKMDEVQPLQHSPVRSPMNQL